MSLLISTSTLGEEYPSLVKKLKELAIDSNVYVLENEMFTLGDIDFLGCTLWTDFRLLNNVRLSAWECEETMNDFRRIRRLPDYKKFKPADAFRAHYQSLEWMKKKIAENIGKTNVVVSHHAPSILSLPKHKHKDLVSAAYASHRETNSAHVWPDFPQNAIAIAEDNTGDILFFRRNKNGVDLNPEIFHYNHEGGAIEKIADNFGELIGI